MDQRIYTLFQEYEKAFSSLDIERYGDLFAETFISAGPRGTIAQDRDEMLKLAQQYAAFYRSVGQTSTRILSMEDSPISNDYTLVTVHWGATFTKTGDRVIPFDVTYIVQHTSPEPRIILFITHQDEEQAMRELGLM